MRNRNLTLYLFFFFNTSLYDLRVLRKKQVLQNSEITRTSFRVIAATTTRKNGSVHNASVQALLKSMEILYWALDQILFAV